MLIIVAANPIKKVIARRVFNLVLSVERMRTARRTLGSRATVPRQLLQCASTRTTSGSLLTHLKTTKYMAPQTASGDTDLPGYS